MIRHPARLPGGKAHSARVRILRTLSELSAATGSQTPLRYTRSHAYEGGTRAVYLIDPGDDGPPIGIEKGQVELFAIGVAIGYLSSGAPVSRSKLRDLLAQVTTQLPDEQAPTDWRM